jgi:hypothetical protein
MSYNRMNSPLDSGAYRFGGEKTPGQQENFIAVPALFWGHLTPEQFRAQQQMYQTAYEKARRQQEAASSGEESSFQI